MEYRKRFLPEMTLAEVEVILPLHSGIGAGGAAALSASPGGFLHLLAGHRPLRLAEVNDGCSYLGHADEFETSMILIRPGHTRMDRVQGIDKAASTGRPVRTCLPGHEFMATTTGRTGLRARPLRDNVPAG